MRGRLLCAAAVLAALPVVTTTAAVRAAGCPALDYQAGLVSATAALRQTPTDVAAALGEVTALVGADRGSEVALGPVLDDLTASPPLVSDARVRLSSMSAALAYPAGSVCNENAGAARDALHTVYASPDFRHLDDSNQPGFLAGVLRFLAGLFGRADFLRLAAALPGAKPALLAGVDAFVMDPAHKAALRQRTGVDVVDTESHVAAHFAMSRGLPFAALRAVSDGAERCLPKAVSVALRPDGNTDVMAVLRSVLAEPAQVPALIHTALEARAGLRALRRSVAVLRGSGV